MDPEGVDDPGGHVVRKVVLAAAVTAVTAALLLGAWRAFGGRSIAFAFAVVWLPMVGLGTVSHVVPVRLPERWHALRGFERDGRLYERLGVRLAKRMLRRGPLARFNPRLHLPAVRNAASLARLDLQMRHAEASHLVLFVLTLAVVVHAAARQWWAAGAFTLLFDVLLNGYPVLLQRYNRAMLDRRFGGSTGA